MSSNLLNLPEGPMPVIVPSQVTGNILCTDTVDSRTNPDPPQVTKDDELGETTSVAVMTSLDGYCSQAQRGRHQAEVDWDKFIRSPINGASIVISTGRPVDFSRGWDWFSSLNRVLNDAETGEGILPSCRTFALDTRINNSQNQVRADNIAHTLAQFADLSNKHITLHGGDRDLYVHAGRSDWSDCNIDISLNGRSHSRFEKLTWQGTLAGMPYFTHTDASFNRRVFILDVTEYCQDQDHDGELPRDFADTLGRISDNLRSDAGTQTELHFVVDDQSQAATRRLQEWESQIRTLTADPGVNPVSSIATYVGSSNVAKHVPYVVPDHKAEL